MTYLLTKSSTAEQIASAITALVNRGAITDLWAARLALEGLYQRSANRSMTAEDRRQALRSARWTAALAADASELAPSLRQEIIAAKESQASEKARLAVLQQQFEVERNAEAAALSDEDVADMLARLPILEERDNSPKKAIRKRARQQMRRIHDLLRRRGVEVA